jgi:hypothetical protein
MCSCFVCTFDLSLELEKLGELGKIEYTVTRWHYLLSEIPQIHHSDSPPKFEDSVLLCDFCFHYCQRYSISHEEAKKQQKDFWADPFSEISRYFKRPSVEDLVIKIM